MSGKHLFTIERLLNLPKQERVDLSATKKTPVDLQRTKRLDSISGGDSAAESDKESVSSDGKLQYNNHLLTLCLIIFTIKLQEFNFLLFSLC